MIMVMPSWVEVFNGIDMRPSLTWSDVFPGCKPIRSLWAPREATRGSSTLSQLRTKSVTSTNQSDEPRRCVVLP